MSEGSSLINFGDLSKPANMLIEKIAEGTGGLFKPWQIKRVAKAEAEALIYKTKAQVESDDLQQRALERFANEEIRKQLNMESIVQKALPDIQKDAKPETMDNDWIANFFDKCRLISDEEMQSFWAKILAGETNKHGSYSKRAVNFLQTIEKKDAELFSILCSYTILVNDMFHPLIFHENDAIYKVNGIHYRNLSHLDTIGLIKYNQLARHYLQFNKNKTNGNLNTQRIIIESSYNGTKIYAGCIFFTQIGQELAKIVEIKPNPEFVNYALSELSKDKAIKITELE